MNNKKLRLIIELTPTDDNDGKYLVKLRAHTRHGPLIRGGFYVPANDGWNTIKRVMASVERTATRRGPGRKRKDYRQCRDVVHGFEAVDEVGEHTK